MAINGYARRPLDPYLLPRWMTEPEVLQHARIRRAAEMAIGMDLGKVAALESDRAVRVYRQATERMAAEKAGRLSMAERDVLAASYLLPGQREQDAIARLISPLSDGAAGRALELAMGNAFADAVTGSGAMRPDISAALYRLPDRRELDAIEQLTKPYLADMSLSLASSADLLACSAASLTEPWINIDDPLSSMQGFAGLAALGGALNSSQPFGIEATIRKLLGNWRGDALISELLRSAEGRAAFYRDHGLDPRLVAFPTDVYGSVLDAAGLSVPQLLVRSEPSPETIDGGEEIELAPAYMIEAYGLIIGFERELRRFINRRMTEACGTNWMKHRVPGDMLAKWCSKQKADTEAGRPEHDPLDYADIGDAATIIVRKDNWREVFAAVFIRSGFIEESIARLVPYRNSAMHGRDFIPEDVLFVRSELGQLVRAIRRHSR